MATICKMLCPFIFLFLFAALSVTGEESVEFFTLNDSLAVALPNEQLKDVSTSILKAENWTRTHIFAYYPAINITTIFAGHNLLCEKGQEHNFILVLPTLRNIHYTLTRWGLQKMIKVSASFSSTCLDLDFETFRDDIVESHIKPLLSFLQETDSVYLVNPNEALISLKSHSKAMKKLGFFNLTKMEFIINNPIEAKSIRRKLSSISPIGSSPDSNSPPAPSPTSTQFSPLIGKISSPPLINPVASPPFGLDLPPCSPSHHGGPTAAPPPVTGVRSEFLWCVAKPNVPQETLQEALDYACGIGGANCEAIRPEGSCYYPNTVFAHASFAFNSYWQKTKSNGGTCGFGGTAMLISSDPSYRHCRFMLI